jgi:high-affinity Fe2+/Pb2+ permease
VDGNGRGGDAVKDIAKIVVAILLIIVAWKIFKGLVGLLLTVAAAGLLIWGGMKLLGNDTKRIR